MGFYYFKFEMITAIIVSDYILKHKKTIKNIRIKQLGK